VAIAAAPQRQPPPNFRVALAETTGVFVARTTGAPSQLAAKVASAIVPVNAWSPEGQRLAFLAFTETDATLRTACPLPVHHALYVVRAPVVVETNATPERAVDTLIEPDISWSKDERHIAVASGCEDPGPAHATALYVVDVTTRLKRRVSEFVNARYPSWSPDGRQIAYSDDRAGGHGVYVVNAASTGESARRIAGGFRPAWSPRGDWIAYVSTAPGAAGGTFVVKPDGTGARQVLSDVTSSVRWSPDGDRLIGVGRTTAIVEMTRFARTDIGKLADARFSPDGRLILYSAPDGIWSVDLKGEKAMRILPIGGLPRYAAFSADHPRQ